jgi:multidrug efflux pump subunit AcrB
LSVPIAVFGAVVGLFIRHYDFDVYAQIGIIMLIGLAAKNAILIVEFARDLRAEGRTAAEAAFEAAHIRLRPILMTSLAFILGVLPLAIANGAGSGSENAVGIGVIGGMLGATILAPLLVPMFFIVIADKLSRGKPASAAAAPKTPDAQPATSGDD